MSDKKRGREWFDEMVEREKAPEREDWLNLTDKTNREKVKEVCKRMARQFDEMMLSENPISPSGRYGFDAVMREPPYTGVKR